MPIDFDKQIPKKGDQRQMEPWQRIGTYAAGLALESANAKGQSELVSRMDMIVAAGGGERDVAVDGAILTGLPGAADPGRFLNDRLMNDLRPTLFLAQLSNLLAGNISIVHGVTGSSRTFMGEESAGIDAVRIALARIQAGQSDIALVGGAHNGERKDLFMLYEAGGYNLRAPFRPVWERGSGRRLCARLARRISGSGERRSRQGAQRRTDCEAFGRAGDEREPQAGHGHRRAGRYVGSGCGVRPDQSRSCGLHFRRDRRRTRHRRGARVSFAATRPFRPAPRAPILVMDLNRNLR